MPVVARHVTRFAPSPTGYLHLGHAHSALAGWRAARGSGGRFLLRIEDIDAQRCRPEFADALLDDLAWLGIDWDGLRVQSRHLPDYRVTLDALARRGFLYPCFCTRADAARSASAPHGPEGTVYPGTCRGLSLDEITSRVARGDAHALRLDLARVTFQELSFAEAGGGRVSCDPTRFGDVVLARKDVPASYHLCATHDDARDGVTLVTRGVDLLAATDLHRLLQALMGWPEPAYAHHALLTDAGGKRLSKRDGSATLRALRAAGKTPAAVRALAGWPD